MHYLIKDNFSNPDVANLSMHLVEDYKFTLTDSLGPSFPHCEFEITEPGEITDYLKCGPITLGSVKLINLYKRLEIQAEYHSVTISLSGGAVLENYKLIHYLEEVDSIDLSKSNYTMDQEYVDEIEKLVLKDIIESKGPIFLAKTTIDRLLICTSKVKSAIQGCGLTGFYFQKPDDRRW